MSCQHNEKSAVILVENMKSICTYNHSILENLTNQVFDQSPKSLRPRYLFYVNVQLWIRVPPPVTSREYLSP